VPHTNDSQGAAIGEVATFIAHELRNVLQVITTSAYAARQGDLSQLAHIERNALRAQQIVSDLLALAGGVVSRSTHHLSEAISLARQDVEPERAEWVDAFTDMRIEVHLGLLARLFHVLYENAVLVKQGGRPTVTTAARASTGTLTVTVTDDGPGVDPSMADRLFEPLATARENGTGLGLALAKRICEAHGGSIRLVPSARGATFEFSLPRAALGDGGG
jgi:two-component system C4-dicarboxylate transport sensor histidine kinase DctB